jgi:hypothetical protein
MEWDGLDSSGSGQGPVNAVMNLRVQNAGKFLNSCTIGGFSRRAELHE